MHRFTLRANTGLKYVTLFLLFHGLAAVNLVYGQDAALNASAQHKAVAEENLETLTTLFLQQLSTYRSAPAAEKSRALDSLTTIAQKRQQHLEDLIKKDPRQVLLRSLSPSVRARVPEPLKSLLEEHIEIAGTLKALTLDHFDKGQYESVYTVKDDRGGQVFTLHFADHRPQGLQSDANVKIKGVRVGQDVALLADSDLSIAFANGETTSSGTSLAAPVVSGDQRVLVIVGDFLDKKVDCSADIARGFMFTNSNSIDALYRETSFGQVSVSGDVAGPYTLPFYAVPGVCDMTNWALAAESAAQAAGVDVNSYPRRIYVLPRYGGCPAAGAGTVGGNPSQAWIWSSCSNDVYAHELGHNLGMDHASAEIGGQLYEYGDNSDVMGLGQSTLTNSKLRQVNAAHKAAAGWLPPERVATVNSSGTYSIEQLEFPTSGPQALKILKPDTSEVYFLSYRRPIGFDSTMPCCGYTDTTSVHRHNGMLSAKSYLLGNLSDGASFVDSVNGLTVRQLSHSASNTTVSVEFGPAVCVRDNPLIVVSPLSQTAPAGTTTRYQLSITNQNTAACSTGSFQLSQNLPGDWAGILSPVVLSIDPGASAVAFWDVTSSGSAANATYSLSTAVTDIADTAKSASASASYTVFTDPCVRVSPGVSITPSGQTGAAGSTLRYQMLITNNNSSGCSTATFLLNSMLPTNWSGVFSATSVSLNSAGNTTVLFDVTSSASAADGIYGITAGAVDATDSSKYAWVNASYAIANDTIAPSVSIVQPSDGGTVARKSKLTITANAADNVGVAKVEFYVNGSLVNTDIVAPYSYSWSVPGVKGRSYQVQAKGFDAAGNMGVSSTVTITAK